MTCKCVVFYLKIITTVHILFYIVQTYNMNNWISNRILTVFLGKKYFSFSGSIIANNSPQWIDGYQNPKEVHFPER